MNDAILSLCAERGIDPNMDKHELANILFELLYGGDVYGLRAAKDEVNDATNER